LKVLEICLWASHNHRAVGTSGGSMVVVEQEVFAHHFQLSVTRISIKPDGGEKSHK
jgi:hypothetical protein